MDRLLLLMTTTTYKAEAFLAAARRLDVEVVVGSDRPQALAFLHPQGHLALPFHDSEAALQKVRDFGASVPLTAIVAADDDGVVLAARLARGLGLPHNEVAAVQAARDKLSTRRALQSAGLPVPGFRCFPRDADPERLAAQVDYPCVLKPLALSGSRGVIRADGPVAFVAAFARVAAILSAPDLRTAGASAEQILVEDYLPGLEVALEGLLEKGALRTLALFDKPDPLEGPFFEETIYVTPSRHPPALQAAVVETVRAAVRALGLHTGPLHAEVRCGAAGTHLVEAAPRSIGGLCARALRFGAGEVSLEELVLRQALGRDTAFEREPSAAGVMMIPIPRAGILRQVGGVEAARAVQHVEDLFLTVASGQPVLPPPEGGRYLGFLFARAATPAAVEAALRDSHARLVLEIEDFAAVPPSGATATPSRREGR